MRRQPIEQNRFLRIGRLTEYLPGLDGQITRAPFDLVGLAVVASNPRKHLGEEIMNRRSFITCAAAALGAFTLSGTMAQAVEVKVLTSVALKSVLDELSPAFEKKTGHKLIVDYGLAADQKKRILDGERADLIILTRAMMEDLAKQNKLTADGLVNVAGTPVALAARAGAPKPDISTADAFKQALLSAKSIVYADPAKGGLSGIVAARAIEQLGIAEQMK